MKKIIVVTWAMMLLSASVVAQQPAENEPKELESAVLTEAPQETVKSMTEMCRSWAKQDGIEDAELSSYLLNCVNDELQSQGYQPVSGIDN